MFLMTRAVPHTVGVIRDVTSVYRLSTIVPHKRLESSSGINFTGGFVPRLFGSEALSSHDLAEGVLVQNSLISFNTG